MDYNLPFWIVIGIGFLIAYMFLPSPTIIYKYPTLDNINDQMYADESGVCYKYEVEKK